MFAGTAVAGHGLCSSEDTGPVARELVTREKTMPLNLKFMAKAPQNRTYRRPGGRYGAPVKPQAGAKNKEECLQVEGVIHSVLPGTMFRVELHNGHLVLAHISGKMRKSFIKLVTGDRVKLEMSPYDIDKGRIVHRIG